MVAGRLMEAWLLRRAEELDAGRAIPSWVETSRVGVAAVLPDRCRPSGKERRGRAEADPRSLPGREVTRLEETRGAAEGESSAGDCPALAARGRRRWE